MGENNLRGIISAASLFLKQGNAIKWDEEVADCELITRVSIVFCLTNGPITMRLINDPTNVGHQ